MGIYKRDGGSESNPTFAFSACGHVGAFSAWRGVDTTTAIDAEGTGAFGTSSAPAASITTATNNAMVIACATDYDGTTMDEPSGWTSITKFAGLSIAYKIQAAAGASGTITFGTSAPNWSCKLIALKPAVTVSAAITGTAQPSATETEIVAGGETIIITLTGDTWIAAGAGSFDLQRDEIIAGIDSAQSEALGWDAVPKITQSLGGVVRTSDTVVTITLDAFATYSITANETITVTVPGTALTGGSPIVASPTFSITDVSSTAVRDIIGMGVVPFAR
jgi:hypothetical protein